MKGAPRADRLERLDPAETDPKLRELCLRVSLRWSEDPTEETLCIAALIGGVGGWGTMTRGATGAVGGGVRDRCRPMGRREIRLLLEALPSFGFVSGAGDAEGEGAKRLGEGGAS